MQVHFYKYQSAGNDFILVDNRDQKFYFSSEQIRYLCHRKLGVGADGLILFQSDSEYDFACTYFNSDGSQTLCCNAYRTAVLFASKVGIVREHKTTFRGHRASYSGELLPAGRVKLKMPPLSKFEKINSDYFVDVGVPHFVRIVEDLEQYPVAGAGKEIRFSERFQPYGVNVNFVELLPDKTIFVRTFERGVEDETLSCATGSVAAAAVAYCNGYSFPMAIHTNGGDVSVEMLPDERTAGSDKNMIAVDVYHTGPAALVFHGNIELGSVPN
jgi:diaminopimelate epimerase